MVLHTLAPAVVGELRGVGDDVLEGVRQVVLKDGGELARGRGGGGEGRGGARGAAGFGGHVGAAHWGALR